MMRTVLRHVRSVRNIRFQHNGPRLSHEASKEAPIAIPAPLTPVWYHRLGPVTNFFGWFHRTQSKRPYTVQVITSIIISFSGDVAAQEIGGEPFNVYRTLRMVTIGAAGAIPGYKWFIFLGNSFNYSSKWLSIFAKVCVQQAVFTPVFNTWWFGMQAALAGESVTGVITRVKEAVPISIVNSAKFWPTLTAISFAFIMPQYRFMFSGVFAAFWQTYLSTLNRRTEVAARETVGIKSAE